MKNMERFERMPFAAQKAVFDRLGSIAEIAAMPEPQRSQYEQSLKVYRDNLSILRTERAEGRAEGRAEVAKRMTSMGMDVDTIALMTGLSAAEIETL